MLEHTKVERCRITNEPIDVETLTREATEATTGGLAIFVGVVRAVSGGRRVLWLEYEAYPEMTEAVMRQIGQEVRERWPVETILMVHRIGRLEVGERSVAIVVGSPHRAEALAACHYAIDRLKSILPIWKKEVFEDGEVWVEGS
ncbi:MAG: molybdenum cofactor biosynthesis protein MoaE [Chloroflexi bacterium]|nr:molybdenum cofactor biosynthesis protein MoaE [Chloroflexota bacterium]